MYEQGKYQRKKSVLIIIPCFFLENYRKLFKTLMKNPTYIIFAIVMWKKLMKKLHELGSDDEGEGGGEL